MDLRGISRNSLAVGMLLLSLSFAPTHAEQANVFRVVCMFLGIVAFSLGLTLSGWVLNHDSLMRYSELLALEAMVATFSLVLINLRLSQHYLMPPLIRGLITITLATFLLLYTYSWLLFRKFFTTFRKHLQWVTSLMIITASAIATYLMPELVPAFVGLEGFNACEHHLRMYYVLSLAMFPALIFQSLLYLTLPDF